MMGVATGFKPRRPIKIEKPRPLKLSSSSSMSASDHNLESVLAEMDLVSQSLQSGAWDQRVLYPSITALCENLKMFGPQLENVYKDQLDKCYIWLRTGCRDDRLSLAARYRLLEIIELRAMNWKPNQNLITYYQSKLLHIEAEEAAMEEQTELAAYMSSPQAALTAMAAASLAATPLQTPTTPSAPLFPHQHAVPVSAAALQYGGYVPGLLPQAQPMVYAAAQYHQAGMIPVEQYAAQQQQLQQQVAAMPVAPLLSPGEVVRTSGKFTKPTRIAGKNYCKDEVVIRNQDSGKVMGIKGRRVHMIEELSETIISFQRVAPGARERLVQITGPSEENITQAKQLIEDTIRRNASPVREAHSLSSGGSSVFSSSPLNGSNSSIASHTDDDNSLNGCKRNTLVHSVSMGADTSETCVGDFRYTVTHNTNAIRINGNNLSMVRTAKLVLDEYFNGERNLNNIAQLLDGVYEPTPPTHTACPPPVPSHLTSPTPSSSSPPLLMKPATPPPTPPPSADAPAGGAAEVAVDPPAKGEESPKNGGVGIVRQPLFPSSSKDAIEAAECSSPGSSGARSRRAAFAKTSEERNSTSDGDEVACDGERVSYKRQVIVALAAAPASKLTPKDWASVVKVHPELVKKGSVYQAGVAATMNEHGESSINGAPTYLQPSDLVSPPTLPAAKGASTRNNGSSTDEDGGARATL